MHLDLKKTPQNCLHLLCWTSSAYQRATGQTASAQGESCFDPLEWILAFAVALRKGRAQALIFSVVFITLWITCIAAAKQLAYCSVTKSSFSSVTVILQEPY